jgi:hypothetical protein
VELSTGKTLFYVRGWVFLGEKTGRLKKAMHAIKRIGHHETRIADDIIH